MTVSEIQNRQCCDVNVEVIVCNISQKHQMRFSIVNIVFGQKPMCCWVVWQDIVHHPPVGFI